MEIVEANLQLDDVILSIAKIIIFGRPSLDGIGDIADVTIHAEYIEHTFVGIVSIVDIEHQTSWLVHESIKYSRVFQIARLCRFIVEGFAQLNIDGVCVNDIGDQEKTHVTTASNRLAAGGQKFIILSIDMVEYKENFRRLFTIMLARPVLLYFVAKRDGGIEAFGLGRFAHIHVMSFDRRQRKVVGRGVKLVHPSPVSGAVLEAHARRFINLNRTADELHPIEAKVFAAIVA